MFDLSPRLTDLFLKPLKENRVLFVPHVCFAEVKCWCLCNVLITRNVTVHINTKSNLFFLRTFLKSSRSVGPKLLDGKEIGKRGVTIFSCHIFQSNAIS